MTTKYMIVSGFLGPGKTMAAIAMARNVNRHLRMILPEGEGAHLLDGAAGGGRA